MDTTRDHFFDVVAIDFEVDTDSPEAYLAEHSALLSSVAPEIILTTRGTTRKLGPLPGPSILPIGPGSSSIWALAKYIEGSAEPNRTVLVIRNPIAFETDQIRELSSVLSLAEKHGIVGARHGLPGQGHVPSRDVHRIAHQSQPRYTVVRHTDSPMFAMSAAALSRVAQNDDIQLSPELLSKVVNEIGLSTVQANHVYLAAGGRPLEHGTDFRPIVASNGVDRFSNHLSPASNSSRTVLIDVSDLDPVWNGTSRNAVSFLQLISQRAHSNPDLPQFVVATREPAKSYFGLDALGLDTIDLDDGESRTFDLGFALVPITQARQIIRLNETCAKWLVSHLDIIAIRSLLLSDSDSALKQTVIDGLRFADRIITISDFSRDDLLAMFPVEAENIVDVIEVCHEGADSQLAVQAFDGVMAGLDSLPSQFRNGFILVVGNDYPHKQMLPTLEALSGHSLPVVALGIEMSRSAKLIGFKSGNLSQSFIAALYRHASAIVYPSAYEGYGLPIADSALFDKPIVLNDTNVAHEITSSLNAQEKTRYFSRFSDIPEIIDELLMGFPNESHARGVRTLNEFNNEIFEHVIDLLDQPVDFDRLNTRFAYVRAISDYTASSRLSHPAVKRNLLSRVLKRLRLI